MGKFVPYVQLPEYAGFALVKVRRMAATNGKASADGFAVDIRALRRSAGLSQQRVAELAGCSLAAVALFERGYSPDTSVVLPRIIAALREDAGRDTEPLRTNAEPGSANPSSAENRPVETAAYGTG